LGGGGGGGWWVGGADLRAQSGHVVHLVDLEGSVGMPPENCMSLFSIPAFNFVINSFD